MNTIWWVGCGGIIGALSRYYAGLWLSRRTAYFPLGTFVINLSGSMLLGILYALHIREIMSEPMWLMFGVGVCGAYTTFSTFGLEAIRLLEKRKYSMAVGYVTSSVALGLAGAWLGIMVGS